MIWLAKNWRLVAALGLLVAAFGGGLLVRDAFCRAKVAGIEREAEKKRADAVERQLEATRKAQANVIALQSALDSAKEQERALPNGNDCGISAGRVRLLPQR